MKNHLQLMFSGSIILLLLSICIYTPAFAEESRDSIQVIARKADPEKTSSGSVTIIKPDEMRGRYNTLETLLEKEASIRVKRYGGLGSYSTLSIRGSNSNQVNIYIDGIPLNNAAYGELNLSDINLDNVERIEIYRSGTPGGFGGSAIGGSVNFVTRKGKELSIRRLEITGGSYHMIRLKGYARGGEKLKWSIGGSTLKSDQDYRYHNDNGTPVLNTWDDRDDIRKNAWLQNISLTGNLRYQIDNTRVFLLNDFKHRRHGVPGPGSNQTEKTERHFLRDTIAAGTDTKGLIIDELRLKSRLFYTHNNEDFFDPEQELSSSNSRTQLQHYGVHLLPIFYLLQYNQKITIFLGNEREIFHRNMLDRFDERTEKIPTKFRNHTSFQFEDELRFLKKRIILTPGIKYEKYVDRFNEFDKLSSNENVFSSDRSDNEFTNYHFGVLLVPFRKKKYKISLKANGSTEKRVPLFTEIFGEGGSIIGNTALKPERARSWDLGTAIKFRNCKYKMDLSIVGFKKTIEDMILLIPNSQFSLRPDNIDAAKIMGGELSIKLRLYNMIKYYTNYTYQKAINTSDVSYLKNKYLPLRPMHEFHGGISMYSNHYEGGFELHHVGAVFKDRTNEYFNYQEGRSIVNIFFVWSYYGRKKRKKELKLGVEVKNIFNIRTEDIIGYPLPGRSLYLSLNWKF